VLLRNAGERVGSCSCLFGSFTRRRGKGKVVKILVRSFWVNVSPRTLRRHKAFSIQKMMRYADRYDVVRVTNEHHGSGPARAVLDLPHNFLNTRARA
jgi:hypothetical protein